MGKEFDERITAFAREVGRGPHERTAYARFDPDGYFTYLLRPEPRAIRWLAERIAGPGALRRAGRTSLVLSARAPPLLRFVPYVSRTELRVPRDSFDVAVVSGTNATLLGFDRGVVWTTPLKGENGLRTTLEVRRSLPEDVSVPELLAADEEYPYTAERLVDGRELSDPVGEWPLFERAFTQLTALYRSSEREFVPMATVLSEIATGLGARGVVDDPVVERARAACSAGSLPEGLYSSRIHGDLHVGNVLRATDGELYVLDWEDSRRGFVVLDFLWSFLMQYYDTGDAGTVREFRSGHGAGGRIAKRYAELCGELAYGSPEWYGELASLYLLYQLATRDQDHALWQASYDLLETLH